MHNEWLTNVVLASGKPYCEPTDVGFDLNPVHAIKKVGKTIGKVARKVRGTVAGSLKRIPAVGPTLSAAWNLNPIGSALLVTDTVGKVSEGQRVDKAAYGALKERVKDIKTVLPLATTLIGMPSVGAGAEGAVAAGNAISKTFPIGKPVLDAVRGELGKAPEAVKAFDTAYAMFQGLPTADNPTIKNAVAIAKSTIGGKSGAAFDSTIATLTPDQKKGVKSAVSLCTAQMVQKSTRDQTKNALPAFFKIGNLHKEKDPVLKLAHQELRHKPDVQKGFAVALGILTHKANPTAIIAARDALEPEERKGFDIASSIRVGQLARPLPTGTKPREKLGYYLSKGSEGLKPEARKQILQSVKNPEMLKGVRKGLHENDTNWFHKVVEFFLGKTAIEKAA
jgi:hypothetical protein